MLSAERARRGQSVFQSEGCGSCHTIRGTAAAGQVGPDLTHVGGRLTLGAGRSEVTPQDFENWIAHTDALKPGVKMPAYDLDPENLGDLAYFLESLK